MMFVPGASQPAPAANGDGQTYYPAGGQMMVPHMGMMGGFGRKGGGRRGRFRNNDGVGNNGGGNSCRSDCASASGKRTYRVPQNLEPTM